MRSKMIKHCNTAQTPSQRILDSDSIAVKLIACLVIMHQKRSNYINSIASIRKLL